MSQNHPYLSLQVPSDAPFRLKPSPGKGWGAFATRRIHTGAMILREKPLFVIPKPHEHITDEDVWSAIQHLAPSAQQQFSLLRDNAGAPFAHLSHALAENSFALPNGSGLPVHGLFLLHSRFNHSCIPNSKIPDTHIDEESITSFATRDIEAGEEIAFCYHSDFECRTRDERHQALRFVCRCAACLPHTPFQRLSDARRTFVRGLQYLVLGVDLDGRRRSSAHPIIADPKLREAAENFSIPLSNRLIYNLLAMYLLEEEGLLDEFVVGRMQPGLLAVVALFGTESNARVAELAMAQETWLEKLRTAFRLYGRADIADRDVAEGLRAKHGLV